MQIDESNWTQPLISSVLNDYNDRFSIERRKCKENSINSTNKRLSKSANLLNMNFYQLNDSSFKKPSISSLSNLTITPESDLKIDDFQLNNKLSSSLKEMSKYEQFNSTLQINAQCEKLSNLTFSNCNCDQYVCNQQFAPSILNGCNLNESVSNNSTIDFPASNLNGGDFMNSTRSDEQSFKTKEFKNFLISDTELTKESGDNSFYCLSNLINSTNDNQISRFICLWLDCNKIFTSQRDLGLHIDKTHLDQNRTIDSTFFSNRTVENDFNQNNNKFICYWLNCSRNVKPFNARYKLTQHICTHTGEKPNHCTFLGCPKSFSRVENLKTYNIISKSENYQPLIANKIRSSILFNSHTNYKKLEKGDARLLDLVHMD